MAQQKQKRERLRRGLAVGAGAALLVVVLSLVDVLEPAELISYDWRTQILTREQPPEDSEVVLVMLDEGSLESVLENHGLSWPWPRELWAVMLDFFDHAEAAAVGFDILFPDFSPHGVHDDALFAEKASEYGRVIHSAFFGNGSTEELPPDAPPPVVTTESELGHSYDRVQLPNEDIIGSAAALGNVHLESDTDQVYRRSPLVSHFDGEPVPSFALAVYAVGRLAESDAPGNRGAENPGAENRGAEEGGDPQAPLEIERRGRSLRIGETTVPTDDTGRSVIRFSRPAGGLPEYKADEVIQSALRVAEGDDPPIDPAAFQDRYVLVGYEAAGLFDLRPSPVSGLTPGVEIHGTMLANLLEDDFVTVPPQWLRVTYAAVIVFAAGLAAALVAGPVLTTLVHLIGIPVSFALGLLALAWGVWLPVAVPTAGAAVAIAGAVVWGYATEGRQRRFIRGAFGQYLSPTVIEALISEPSRLRLGGVRREISVFFSDIQGFTSISELLTPEELTALLNEYLSAMTDIVLRRGGTIDKYEGDAIIAFWNAPLEQEDHPRQAVLAALECQNTLAELRPRFRERVDRDLLMRVGLNTGPAVVGNLGSTLRFDYTMLGDTVNLGARLEGVNKQFGTYTMVSQMTKQACESTYDAENERGETLAFRELGRIGVVGREEPVTVYEPMYAADYRAQGEALKTFAAALQAYYAGRFDDAAKTFESIAEQDPPAKAYVERCRMLAANPPQAWNGVWVMTSK